MAPEPPPRPGGISLPGTRDSAAPEAARSAGGDGPSREEVQQRVSSLYDQAENATGNYNATRAMSTGTRKRVDPVRPNQRTSAERVLDDVARPWFDVGRAQLGPTVPARLPADRMPSRPAEARPPRPEGGRTDRERETAGRPVPELTAGPAAGRVPELTAGPTAGRVPELTAGPIAGRVPELTAGPGAGPVAELTSRAVAALPAAPEMHPWPTQAPAAPAAEPAQSALKTSKTQIQRKLAVARELLSAHAVRQSTQFAAIESRPATEIWPAPGEPARGQVAEQWQFQQQTDLGMAPSTGVGVPVGAGLPFDVGVPVGAGLPFDVGLPAGTSLPFDVGLPAGTSLPMDTGLPVGASLPIDVSMPVGAVSASDSGFGRKAATAVAFARAQIGRPCVWGASGPDSYDGAGLTRAAWTAAGVVLPRTVREQSTAGTAISLADIRLGDLIFFYADAGHVGLYIGDGMMIHAPSPGAHIREDSLFYAGQAAIHSATRPG
jgi:cell wall-associated NlpC family hydrolase